MSDVAWRAANQNGEGADQVSDGSENGTGILPVDGASIAPASWQRTRYDSKTKDLAARAR